MERPGQILFLIFLPLTSEDAACLPASPQVIHGSGRILVVEDEHIMRVIAKAILENLGYKVVLAENGLVGLTLFEEDPPAFQRSLATEK